MNWRVSHILIAASLSVSAVVASALSPVEPAAAQRTNAVPDAFAVEEPPTTPPPGGDSTAPPTTAPPTTAPPTTPPPTAPPPTAPPTTAPSTTGSSGEPTTTTAPDGSTTTDSSLETTTTLDGETTTSGLGEFGEGGASNPDGDPLTEEGPLETVPDFDVTVPPTTEGATADPRIDYRPDEVLISSVAEARVKLGEAEERFRAAIAHVKSLRLRGKELDQELESLDEETREAIIELEEAERRLRVRATSAFTRGDGAGISLDHDNLLEYQAQQTIVETVFELDDDAIREYVELRGSLDVDALGQVDRRAIIDDLLVDALLKVEDEALAVEQAGRELVVFEAGSLIYIENVTFPIAGDYGRPLIDSWGYPRMPGTSDAHAHQGIDIFAPMGTPLVAAERGVLTRIGVGRLGGLKLWLRGESGTDWYYAHLSAFAPGIADGQVVEVGELIGYVGDTGNAKGTPPHLHLQVHPNGGDAINPYPMLRVISDSQIALEGG